MAFTHPVTVVTPVRDTPIPVFQRAFASLKSQSFGFEKIQWVIVFHHCSSVYKDEVSSLLDGYPNITLAAEERAESALSDARNRTLDLAEGKWLFFLDSDDELKADVISEVVGHMEASDADTGIFGAEIDYNGFRVTSLPDAGAEEAVVLSGGDERIGKGLCEYGLYLWTRCYRRQFLAENGIRFRPHIDFGEDLTFNIDATAAAGKVLILPGLSGHADRLGLLEWIGGFKTKPRQVFVVHGEDQVAEQFAKTLNEDCAIRAFAPFSGTRYDLASGKFIEITKGIPITKVAPGRTVSNSFTKLKLTARKVLDFVNGCSGLPNKDLERFSMELEALCEKYKR